MISLINCRVFPLLSLTGVADTWVYRTGGAGSTEETRTNTTRQRDERGSQRCDGLEDGKGTVSRIRPDPVAGPRSSHGYSWEFGPSRSSVPMVRRCQPCANPLLAFGRPIFRTSVGTASPMEAPQSPTHRRFAWWFSLTTSARFARRRRRSSIHYRSLIHLRALGSATLFRLGADERSRWAKCMNDPSPLVRSRLAQDSALIDQLRLQRTPTFMGPNGSVTGVPTLSSLIEVSGLGKPSADHQPSVTPAVATGSELH